MRMLTYNVEKASIPWLYPGFNRPAKSCKRASNARRLFCVKITDIFDQKNTFSNFGAIQGNFTIWNNEKEPAVIERMKQSAET